MTFSFCHGCRSARTAMAILVSKRTAMGAGHAPQPGPAAGRRLERWSGIMGLWPGRTGPGTGARTSVPVEAMHAHFTAHVYHRHSHESYSFGVTETGAQAFTCRHGRHVSGRGMVMAFNPDDPHDGHAADGGGFTYRMVHIWPEFFASLTGTPAAAVPLAGDRGSGAGRGSSAGCTWRSPRRTARPASSSGTSGSPGRPGCWSGTLRARARPRRGARTAGWPRGSASSSGPARGIQRGRHVGRRGN